MKNFPVNKEVMSTDKSADGALYYATHKLHPSLFEVFFARSASGVAVAELLTDELDTPQDIAFIATNRAFEVHTGLEARTLPGCRVTQVLPEIPLHLFLDACLSVVVQKEHVILDRWVEVLKRHLHIQLYPHGETNQFVAVVQDVTGPKQRDSDLAATRTLLDGTLDAISDIIIIYSPDGDVISLNTAGKEHLELREKQKELRENIGPLAVNRCEGCPFIRALNEKTLVTAEVYDEWVNQYYECRANPIFDAAGEVQSVIVQKRDIGEQKQREFSLQEAKDRAEKADRLKSYFLSNISHELRTPLNAVIGLSQLMLETDLDEEQTDSLSLIEDSGSILLKIVNSVLTYTEIEDRRIRISPRPVDLKETVQKLIAVLKSRAERKDLLVRFDWDDAIPQYVQTDDFRLQQILVQIGENAIKFTSEGSIHFNVQLKERQDDQVIVCFTIRDTGIGIDPANREDIFAPFVQQDGSYTRRYNGLGIGLTLARELAVVMGGNVECVSSTQNGSEFLITLPFTLSDTPSPGEPQTAAPLRASRHHTISPKPKVPERNNSLRVLVVEDNVLNRLYFTKLLASKNVDADVVADGYAALEHLKKNAVDILVVDLQMPGMDGFELVEKIRGGAISSEHQRVPVIAVSAYVNDDIHARCAQAGINEFIAKPVNGDRLISTINKLLPTK